MKRKLALLLALVMILSLVPTSVFAASTNAVNKVPQIADDYAFTAANAPLLSIEEKNNAEFPTGSAQTFRLNLTNAEWVGTTTEIENGQTGVTVTKLTDTSVEVTVYGQSNVAPKEMFFFPLIAEAQGTGDLKVTIDPRDSAVSAGTYTFAVAATGKTIATVNGDAKTITRADAEVAQTIMIDETKIGALTGTQRFKLRLPSGFEWNSSTVVKFDGATLTSGVVTNERYLEVTFNAGTSATARRSMIIMPEIDVTRDAKFGEVKVDVIGQDDINTEYGLHIANYKDYGVTVKVKEVKEYFSGRLDADQLTAVITIEEVTENSLFDGRRIDFELPEWVKLVEGEFTVGDITSKESTLTSSNLYIDKYGSKFELTIPTNTNKEKFEFKLPLTFKADKAGDVVLKIKGAGVQETELVVAKAIAPITAEIKVADVRLGVQKQAAPEIIIKENKAGALVEGEDLLIWFKDSAYNFRFDDAVVEVIDGDLEIDEDNAGKDTNTQLIAPIEVESTKPSTIKISGIQLTLDRSVPEGIFQVRVGGDALVENNVTLTSPKVTDYYTKDFTSRVGQFDFANVVNRAPGEIAAVSMFVIDSKTYKVLEGNVEVEKMMDVAPFIADGRTFLPIRFVAEALGVAADNIMWNAETKTVTILKGDRIVAMTIGSRNLTVNGTVIPMDTAAMVKDGRTVLPVRFVAQALGAQIEWNAETRTVTVTK